MDWNFMGFFVGFLSLLWVLKAEIDKKQQKKRNQYVLHFLDLNINKDISEKKLQQLDEETQNQETKVKQLNRHIKEEVPKLARITFAMEQLNQAKDNVMEAYQKWQKLETNVKYVADDFLLLPRVISHAIEEQLQPEYIKRKKISHLQSSLAISGALMGLISFTRGIIPIDLYFPLIVPLAVYILFALLKLKSLQIKKRLSLPRKIGFLMILSGLILIPVYQSNKFEIPSDIFAMYVCLSIISGLFFLFFDWFQNKSNVDDSINPLISEGKLKEAIDLIQIEMTDKPNNHELKFLLADILLMNGEPLRAAKIVALELQRIGKSTFSILRKNDYSHKIIRIVWDAKSKDQALQFINQIITLSKNNFIEFNSKHITNLESIKNKIEHSREDSFGIISNLKSLEPDNKN